MRTKTTVNLLAGLILLTATGVLAGWALELPLLISYSANMTAMNPVTATCFLLIATWLFLAVGYRKSPHPLQYLISTIVLLCGAIKLMDYEGIIHFHIDNFLFAGKLQNRYLHNAVAPTTALLFVCTGLSFINSGLRYKWSARVQDILIIGSFLTSYLGAIGYIYSLEPFYRIGPFVPMALNTSLCFMTAQVAIFLATGKGNVYTVISSRNLGGRLARKAIPFLLLIPPAFGYARLIMQRARIYDTEYGIAIDTAFIVLLALMLLYYYARVLNKQDAERRRITAEIKHSEEKYRSLVYALREGVIYYTAEGNILFYNKSFCDITGFTETELIGNNILEMLVSREEQKQRARRLEEIRLGIAKGYETKIRHKDGSDIWVQVNAAQLKEANGSLAYFSTISDISIRKKHEEDIEAFSASAAHDLNSPLARIEMTAAYLLDFSSDHFNAEDIAFVKAIVKTSKDMRVMLRDLLYFSSIGTEHLEKRPVDMEAAAQIAVESAIYLNPNAEVCIEPMPPANGYGAALRHVWNNLVLNAIKYSAKCQQARVHIGAYNEDGKTIYFVKDNGAGFDMSLAGNLFLPFKRLHTSGEFEGNGLGLPIVKRIVEKHGGKVWANAEKGKGASFYFSL